MSTLAAATSLLDRVHDALADHETPCRITRSPDGSAMIVVTESGDRISVTARDNGKLTVVHNDWHIAIDDSVSSLDPVAVTGYIEFTALQGADHDPSAMWTPIRYAS